MLFEQHWRSEESSSAKGGSGEVEGYGEKENLAEDAVRTFY